MAFGETRRHREEREARQSDLYPELELSDIDGVFAVDRLRREESRPLTSVGMAVEGAMVRSRPPVDEEEEALGAQRGFFEPPPDPLPQPSPPSLQQEEGRRRLRDEDRRLAQREALGPDPGAILTTPEAVGGVVPLGERPVERMIKAFERGGPPRALLGPDPGAVLTTPETVGGVEPVEPPNILERLGGAALGTLSEADGINFWEARLRGLTFGRVGLADIGLDPETNPRLVNEAISALNPLNVAIAGGGTAASTALRAAATKLSPKAARALNLFATVIVEPIATRPALAFGAEVGAEVLALEGAAQAEERGAPAPVQLAAGLGAVALGAGAVAGGRAVARQVPDVARAAGEIVETARRPGPLLPGEATPRSEIIPGTGPEFPEQLRLGGEPPQPTFRPEGETPAVQGELGIGPGERPIEDLPLFQQREAAPEVAQRLTEMRSRLTRGPEGTVRPNKANDALLDEIGALGAQSDYDTILRSHSEDLRAALPDLEAEARRLSDALQLRDTPEMRARELKARREGRSGVVPGSQGLAGDELGELRARAQRSFQLFEEAERTVRELDAAGLVTPAGAAELRAATAPDETIGAPVLKATPEEETEAIRQLLASVQAEANIRRIAQAEVAAGRAQQVARGTAGVEAAAREGRGGTAAVEAGIAGARVGQMRTVFAEPLNITPRTASILDGIASRKLLNEEIQYFDWLRAVISIKERRAGQGLNKSSIDNLRLVYGDETAEMLARHNPADIEVRQTRRTEAREIEVERNRQTRLAEQQQRAQVRAQETASKREIREAETRLGRVERERTRAIEAANRAEARELEETRRWNERAARPRPQTAAERRELTAAANARERLLEQHPNDQMILQRTIDATAAAAFERGLSGEADAAVGEAIRHWLASNRAQLDALGPTGSELLAMVKATITGDVADSWLTAALHRRNTLSEALRIEGLDDKSIRKITKGMFDFELTRRYPNGVPRRIDRLLKQTGGIPYSEAMGGFDLFVQRWKNTIFGVGDIAIFGIQVPAAIQRGGIPMMAGLINRSLAAMHLPSARIAYADSNLRLMTQLELDGVHQGIGPSPVVAKQGSILQYLGPAGRQLDRPYTRVADALANFQYGTVLTFMRNLTYEGDLTILRVLGRDISDPVVRAQAAANANAITLFANTALNAGRRGREHRIFISPSMTRAKVAQLVQLADLIRPGASAEQRILAAMMITSTVTTTLMLGKFLNDQMGLGDFQFDPSLPGFAQITTDAKDRQGRNIVIDVIPQDSVIRAFAKSVRAIAEADPEAAGKAWVNMLLGASGPGPRAIAGLGGVGYEPGGGWRYGDLSQNARIMGVAPIPPILQQAMLDGIDAVPLGLEGFGVTNFPESAFRRGERALGEAGVDVDTLTRTQKQAELAATGQGEEIEAQRVTELRQSAATGNRTAEALLISVETRDRLAELAASGVSPADYRRQRTTIMAEGRGAMRKFADVFEGFKESEIEAERDASRWFDLFDQAAGPGDVVDWDRFEIEEGRLRAELGVARFDAAMAEINAVDPRDNPMEQELQRVRNDLEAAQFFDIRDQVWASIIAQDPSLAEFETVDALEAAIVGGLEQRGVAPNSADSIILVKKVMEGIPAVERWREISNDVEEAWINAFPSLARRAFEWDYLRSPLRKDEERVILEAATP